MNFEFLILLFSLLSVVSSQKLTEEENEMRKKTCGINLKLKSSYSRKVMNGVRAKITEAPWNVAIEVMNGVPGLCTGTLISPRHVITARHCFANLNGDQYKWITKPEQDVPGCDNGEEDIVLEQNFDDMFKVYIGTDCGYRKHCDERKNFTEIGIHKVVLPKTCDDRTLDFDDFAIVELSKNVEFSKRVQPICVADNETQLLGSDSLTRLYGYGLDPTRGENSAGPLRYETVKAVKCEYLDAAKTFCTKSVSGRQLACMGDSGAGVVRKVKGRVTLLGVIFQGAECKPSVRNEKDHIANVVHYSEDICKYTGVCSK